MQHSSGCQCKEELIPQSSGDWLLPAILKESVTCGNEESQESCRCLFSSHSQRFENLKYCCSPVGEDVELLLSIPFANPCTLHSLYILSPYSNTFPKTVRIYADKPDLDFASVQDLVAVQEFEVVEDLCGNSAHPLKVSKLKNITSVQIFFVGSGDADQIKLQYIGLKGERTAYRREAVRTVYESRANMSDHQTKQEDFKAWGI